MDIESIMHEMAYKMASNNIPCVHETQWDRQRQTSHEEKCPFCHKGQASCILSWIKCWNCPNISELGMHSFDFIECEHLIKPNEPSIYVRYCPHPTLVNEFRSISKLDVQCEANEVYFEAISSCLFCGEKDLKVFNRGLLRWIDQTRYHLDGWKVMNREWYFFRGKDAPPEIPPFGKKKDIEQQELLPPPYPKDEKPGKETHQAKAPTDQTRTMHCCKLL
jgi:hypothetical protein